MNLSSVSDERVTITEPVRAALAGGKAVVALESTLITHGFQYPHNLEVAHRAEKAVQEVGAVPATVAIHSHQFQVGLDEAQLAELATSSGPMMATRSNLASALVNGGWAGTTVAATMIAAAMVGIRVFATGGIGGVHRGASVSFDISPDLQELAKTPVVVVCAGPKSILDLDLTLEYLETHGVPVVGLGTDKLPGFWARESDFPVPITATNVPSLVDIILSHWSLPKAGGIVVAVPVPSEYAIPREEADAAIAQAISDAEQARIRRLDVTPWLLARVAEITGGRSVRANIALIENNARLAAQVSIALSNAVTA